METAQNPVACCFELTRKIAPDLSSADRQEVVSAALVRITEGTEHYLSAVRWSLADWLRDRTEIPQPVDDLDLKRELQHARRALRSASETELSAWDALLGRMTEREQAVAVRLASGFSELDIVADTQLSKGTVGRIKQALRRKFGDSVLWVPILDALWDLPASKADRAEYVTDLAEYRNARVGQRHATLGKRGRKTTFLPRFSTWFVPCHATRQSPMAWYPGIPIRRWEPTTPSGLWAQAWELLSFGPKHAGKRSQEDLEQISLKPRELSGLQRGERWFFEGSKGTMISSPVIRRKFDASGMFRLHVQ